jgi:regulator of replication initiation timing
MDDNQVKNVILDVGSISIEEGFLEDDHVKCSKHIQRLSSEIKELNKKIKQLNERNISLEAWSRHLGEQLEQKKLHHECMQLREKQEQYYLKRIGNTEEKTKRFIRECLKSNDEGIKYLKGWCDFEENPQETKQ